jgi:hypothetical protein
LGKGFFDAGLHEIFNVLQGRDQFFTGSWPQQARQDKMPHTIQLGFFLRTEVIVMEDRFWQHSYVLSKSCLANAVAV